MPDSPNQRPDDLQLGPGPNSGSDQKRLSDDRGGLGSDFEHAPAPGGSGDRSLEESYLEHNRGGSVETVGDQFADPSSADRHRLGESFADPNSLDDTRLGESFAESNSSPKHRRDRRKNAPGKARNYRVFYLVAAVVLLVFLIIFFAGFLPRHDQTKKNDEKARQEQNATPTIQVLRVDRPGTGSPLVVPGTTTPLVEAYLYARANGYLSKRLVDIGDHVRKGQLLAIIDSPDLDQQVDQAREQVRQAEQQLAQQQTQLALTKITNDRYRVLVAKGVFSRQDGDQQDTNFNAQVANVAAAQRNVDAYQANLRRTIALQSYERVTAPFDGVVTERNIDVGALISASGAGSAASSASAPPTGGTTTSASANTSGSNGSAPTAATPMNAGAQGGPLFSIAQTNRLRILVSVPEGYAAAVHRGQTAVLHFQEYPTVQFKGLVTRTANSIDQNTRTMLTEVQVDNKDGRLLDGMYAVASFSPSDSAGPITIAGDAVAVRSGRNIVGVVHDGKVHIQPVTVGRDFGPVIEILGGLKVGDLIAANVDDNIREDAKVDAKVTQPQGPASPKAPDPSQTNQNLPPGGSTQYGDQSITDRNMQGVNAQGGGAKGKSQSKQPRSSAGGSQQ